MGTTAVATRYRVGESRVRRKQRHKATGETAPGASGRRPCARAPHVEVSKAAAAAATDATPRALKGRLGLTLSSVAPLRAVASPGLTFEKKSIGRRSGPAPTSRPCASHGSRRGRGSTRRG